MSRESTQASSLKQTQLNTVALPWKEYVVKHGRIIGVLMVIVISASPNHRRKVIRTSSLDTEYYERHYRTSLNGIVVLG